MNLKEYFIRALFPPKCIGCKSVLPIGKSYPLICKICNENNAPLTLRTCPSCLKPLDLVLHAPYCPYCSKDKYNFEYLIAVGHYEGLFKNAVLKLKFSNKPHTAKSMAYMLYEKISKNNFCVDAECICYAPISKKRLKERKYNQSHYIAEELSYLLKLPVINVLEKVKDTPAQSSLGRKQREKNLVDAIIFKEPLKYQNVIFVDDVYTTGTTAKTCCSELKKAGAKKIYVAVFAVSGKEE